MTDPDPRSALPTHKFIASDRSRIGSRCQICGQGSFDLRHATPPDSVPPAGGLGALLDEIGRALVAGGGSSEDRINRAMLLLDKARAEGNRRDLARRAMNERVHFDDDDFGTDEPRTMPASCTHYCEGGHFDGDDMVMVDIDRLHWKERAERAEVARPAASALVEALQAWERAVQDSPTIAIRNRRAASILRALAAQPPAPAMRGWTNDQPEEGRSRTGGTPAGPPLSDTARGRAQQEDRLQVLTAQPPAPASVVAWTVVPGEDNDCGVCGRAKLRRVAPKYEPGGRYCDECGWDSRDTHPKGDHEHIAGACGMSCGNQQPAPDQPPLAAAALAQLFHETYERLAPRFGYKTRKDSAVPWADVPATNKALMTAVAAEVRAALSDRAVPGEP